MPLWDAVESLKRGGFVLLHDSAGREDEVDMVAAAASITPEQVARMRQDAGGMICLAIEGGLGERLGIRYMHELLSQTLDPDLKSMIVGSAPYGDRPAFSITLNYYQNYTGVTDRDRSITIKEMANLYGTENPREKFTTSFRTPGHVTLLVASEELLAQRRGHTELSIYLAKIAGLAAPAMAICEMLDADTHLALSTERAREYAEKNTIPFIDGRELIEYSRMNRS